MFDTRSFCWTGNPKRSMRLAAKYSELRNAVARVDEYVAVMRDVGDKDRGTQSPEEWRMFVIMLADSVLDLAMFRHYNAVDNLARYGIEYAAEARRYPPSPGGAFDEPGFPGFFDYCEWLLHWFIGEESQFAHRCTMKANILASIQSEKTEENRAYEVFQFCRLLSTELVDAECMSVVGSRKAIADFRGWPPWSADVGRALLEVGSKGRDCPSSIAALVALATRITDWRPLPLPIVRYDILAVFIILAQICRYQGDRRDIPPLVLGM